MTFNHALGACLMISISVENNGNKCQDAGSHTITWPQSTQSHQHLVINTNQPLQLNTYTVTTLQKLSNLALCLQRHSQGTGSYGRKAFVRSDTDKFDVAVQSLYKYSDNKEPVQGAFELCILFPQGKTGGSGD